MYKYIGGIRQTSSQLLLIDPFYQEKTDGVTLNDLIPGIYYCYTTSKHDEHDNIKKVASVYLIHKSLYQIESSVVGKDSKWETNAIGKVSVDSSTLAIVDIDYWKSESIDPELIYPTFDYGDSWENYISEKLDVSSTFISSKGVYVSTGLGDGNYSIYRLIINDQFKGIRVDFF